MILKKIFPHGAGKQVGRLTGQNDLAPEMKGIVIKNVFAVIKNTPSRRGNGTVDKPQQRALPASAGTEKKYYLPGLHFHVRIKNRVHEGKR